MSLREDSFFRRLEEQVKGVPGGDGLTDEERVLFYRGLKEIGTYPKRSSLTEEECKRFQEIKNKFFERQRMKNNPDNVEVNIRPGVLLNVRRSERSGGQIESDWTISYRQNDLDEGLITLEKLSPSGEILEKDVPIRELAELNDLQAIMSSPENVMEYQGFRVLTPVRVKGQDGSYIIYSFEKHGNEVKAKIIIGGTKKDNFRFRFVSLSDLTKVNE